jgi:hypothetical protein
MNGTIDAVALFLGHFCRRPYNFGIVQISYADANGSNAVGQCPGYTNPPGSIGAVEQFSDSPHRALAGPAQCIIRSMRYSQGENRFSPLLLDARE